MPTTAKSSAKYGKLGDLSTYTVSTTAVPVDTADSSGSVPTISATLVDGADVEYLIGEDFAVESPSLGKYDGEIVSVNNPSGSNRYNIDVHNILARLNTEQRLYPMSDYSTLESSWLPVFTLEYWTQQCGIFYTKVPGTPLFYQSQWGHYGAWAKDVTRPLKSALSSISGEVFQPQVIESRLMNNMPRNSTATITFPTQETLSDLGKAVPVLIPSSGYMVFGGTLGIFGTSRRGSVTWTLVDPKGLKRAIRVTGDTNVGLTLYTSENGTAFTSRGSIAAAPGIYAFYVGVSYSTANGTRFDFSAYAADGSPAGSLAHSTTTTGIRDSLSLTQVTYRGDDVGSGDRFLYSDIFVSGMNALPVGRLPIQKSITTGYKTSSHMVGFSGNVWEHMKQYCSIYHLDVNYRNGMLTFEPRQKNIKVGASFSTMATSVANRETARHVEVVNQQHEPTGNTPKVMWSADTVYQVAVGEVQEFVVQTDHSIMALSQPVCVSGIWPYPYTSGAGQYVVTGSDGYIVSPQFWADQGGSITCDITENEGEIKIRIKGPDMDSSRAPYRISEGDAGRPALYITGQGVKANPKKLKVSTGNNKAAKDVGVTIDSPFISGAKYAYDVAARAAKAFATPEVQVSFNEPISYDGTSALGAVPAGQLVKQAGNIYRVNSVTQSPSMINGGAVQHNTLYQLKRSFKNSAGAADTIGAMNDYYNGKPLGKVNLKPLKEVK